MSSLVTDLTVYAYIFVFFCRLRSCVYSLLCCSISVLERRDNSNSEVISISGSAAMLNSTLEDAVANHRRVISCASGLWAFWHLINDAIHRNCNLLLRLLSAILDIVLKMVSTTSDNTTAVGRERSNECHCNAVKCALVTKTLPYRSGVSFRWLAFSMTS